MTNSISLIDMGYSDFLFVLCQFWYVFFQEFVHFISVIECGRHELIHIIFSPFNVYRMHSDSTSFIFNIGNLCFISFS